MCVNRSKQIACSTNVNVFSSNALPMPKVQLGNLLDPPLSPISKAIMKFSTAIVTILSAASAANGFVATPHQCE